MKKINTQETAHNRILRITVEIISTDSMTLTEKKYSVPFYPSKLYKESDRSPLEKSYQNLWQKKRRCGCPKFICINQIHFNKIFYKGIRMSLNISSKKGRVVVIYSNFFRKDK
jgi:hypothetical protein